MDHLTLRGQITKAGANPSGTFLVAKPHSKVFLTKFILAFFQIKLYTALYYNREAVRIENITVKLCGIDRAR